jgi:hypothetical protein
VILAFGNTTLLVIDITGLWLVRAGFKRVQRQSSSLEYTDEGCEVRNWRNK